MTHHSHEKDHLTLIVAAVIGLIWATGQSWNNAAQISQWLRNHHLCVPASDAILLLPDTDAGLDLPRLVLLAGTTTLILLLLHHHRLGTTRTH